MSVHLAVPSASAPLHDGLIWFLPRDAMLSAVYAVVVCLSVCHTPVLYQNG